MCQICILEVKHELCETGTESISFKYGIYYVIASNNVIKNNTT